MRGLVAVGAVLAFLACVAVPAYGTHVSCGQTITTDTTLDSDLACSGDGIIIGASGVDLDLDGHSVTSGREGIKATNQRSVSVRNGTVSASIWAVTFGDVTDGLVTGLTVEGPVRLGGQPTRNVVQDSIVHGLISVNEDRYFASHPFRRTDNRIERNQVDAITMYLSDGNVVRDNDIVAFSINVVGSTSFTSDEDNGADENLIEGNRIPPSAHARSYAIVVAQDSRRNVIRDNHIAGGFIGILVTIFSDDTQVEGNRIEDTRDYGIEFGDPPYATGPSVVQGNVIKASGKDGIAVRSTAQGVVVRDNVVSGNGDDGIDADNSQTTIEGNTAFSNLDWGIEAIAGVSDGGGNRAWSNGQPAQCLNVVCGPGPPAALSLSPESGTNTVGERHCVTATVADPDGRATPGETVSFSLNGDESATQQTDAGGTTTFCYDGPLAPGTDAIAAFADADGDGAHDAGEPGDTATKTWIVPASTRCRVSGKGAIAADSGDQATFDLNVHVTGNGRPQGRHAYRDMGPATRLTARSRTIDAITCANGTASIFGTVRVSGATAPARFRIDLTDSPDTYRIRLGNGYDSGEATPTSGNVQIR